jgi:hypothetical protein
LVIDEYILFPKTGLQLVLQRSDPHADASSPFTLEQLSAEFMFADLSKHEETLPDHRPLEIDVDERKETFT